MASKKTTSAPAAKAGESKKPVGTHPLLRQQSYMEGFQQRRAAQSAYEEKIVENQEEWQKAVNRIAQSNDGKLFLKMMIKYGKIFDPRDITNTVKMVEDAGKANFYLLHVRPYIDKNLIGEIE